MPVRTGPPLAEIDIMDDLFSTRTFTGFGPSRYHFEAEPLKLQVVEASKRAGLRSKLRLICPRRPGVYGIIGGDNELLYVGKAKCLRTRLLSYFRKKRDRHARKVFSYARSLVWEPASSEFAALLRELELIQRWRPRLNVKDQPRRYRRVYVCLGRQPAPYVFLATRPTSRTIGCYGPVPARRIAGEAVRRINDFYLLRDCPQAQEMIFAEQRDLFPVPLAAGCVRLELGGCLGPCVAACTQTRYAEQVQAARSFLEGRETSALDATEQAMGEASTALQFERAAGLRDKLSALRWLHHHLDRVRHARDNYSFIYPVSGYRGEDVWYLIHQGQVIAATPAPMSAESKQTASLLVDSVYRQKQGSVRPLPSAEVNSVLLVGAWFRKRPGELARVISVENAREGL